MLSYIYCQVCCVLPLAVSHSPEWEPKDIFTAKHGNNNDSGIAEDEEDNEEDDQGEHGAGNVAFEDEGINLDSITSTIHIIKKERPGMKRTNTMMYQVMKTS